MGQGRAGEGLLARSQNHPVSDERLKTTHGRLSRTKPVQVDSGRLVARYACTRILHQSSVGPILHVAACVYLAGQPPNDKTTAAMAAAGVASLFVCYDNLTADDAAIIRCKPSNLAEEA